MPNSRSLENRKRSITINAWDAFESYIDNKRMPTFLEDARDNSGMCEVQNTIYHPASEPFGYSNNLGAFNARSESLDRLDC